MDANQALAERFEEHRIRLRAVAYRLLGSLSEADDAVQEAGRRDAVLATRILCPSGSGGASCSPPRPRRCPAGLCLGLGHSLGTHRPEARVITKVEIDVSTQQPVLLKHRPATAAGGIALVVAFPGELDTRAPIALAAVAVHPPLDGNEPEMPGPVGAELHVAGPEEVDSLSIPEVHLHNPPHTGHTHHHFLRNLGPQQGWISS